MARSFEPFGGWKRKASSPPGSNSSAFAYLFIMGVSASGSDAANGSSAASEKHGDQARVGVVEGVCGRCCAHRIAP
eukprot:697996-Prymnesium_polylepis.1